MINNVYLGLPRETLANFLLQNYTYTVYGSVDNFFFTKRRVNVARDPLLNSAGTRGQRFLRNVNK